MRCGSFDRHSSLMQIYVGRASTIPIFTMCYINLSHWCMSHHATMHLMYTHITYMQMHHQSINSFIVVEYIGDPINISCTEELQIYKRTGNPRNY
jgi:hypothetical protein